MGQKALEELAQKLRDDAALRDEFRNDPEAVLTRLGVSLSEAAKKTVRGVNWKKMGDDELLARIGSRSDFIQWHSGY